jgi:hypothetical protein
MAEIQEKLKCAQEGEPVVVWEKTYKAQFPLIDMKHAYLHRMESDPKVVLKKKPKKRTKAGGWERFTYHATAETPFWVKMLVSGDMLTATETAWFNSDAIRIENVQNQSHGFKALVGGDLKSTVSLMYAPEDNFVTNVYARLALTGNFTNSLLLSLSDKCISHVESVVNKNIQRELEIARAHTTE